MPDLLKTSVRVLARSGHAFRALVRGVFFLPRKSKYVRIVSPVMTAGEPAGAVD